MFFFRLRKLLSILQQWDYLSALVKYRVAGVVEHQRVLRQLRCKTVVDIGANRGQFSLVVRHCFPAARIIAFEPLVGPAAIYRSLFRNDAAVNLHQAAIGPIQGQAEIHVSGRDDSSSLLPITMNQTLLFPGTAEISTISIPVGPLEDYVAPEDIEGPAMLKLDVQGFELQALLGCAGLLNRFKWVYVECSFIELYGSQALVHEVIAWLHSRGFRLSGVYNMTYDRAGRAIQGDFLFEASSL